MGKLKKEYQRLQRELQAAYNRQQQKSNFEIDLENQYNQNKAFLDSKDYRNVPGGIDMMPLSELKRMQSYGQRSQKGAPNATAVEMSRDLDNNLLTREWGSAYENKVAGLRDRNNALVLGLQGLHSDRMNAGVAGAQAMLQSQAQLKQMYPGFNWGQLLMNGIGAGSSIAQAAMM